MENVIYKNKVLLCAIVFALIACTVLFTVQDVARVAYAENAMSFDGTNVLDDLQSSTVNGKSFDILDYSFDETKRMQIINFVEYCYSYKANMQSHYGIYIYVYNPQGVEIVENSGQNKIQMAVSWAKNDDGTYSATRYEKFNLKFCNKSERANYRGLFYKFKVVDKKVDGKSMVERVNSNERRYDVSGIELLTSGNANATEYGVGGTYKFTGYVKGYGPDTNAESTLSCVVEDLETLELSVHHTYYRTNVSSLGNGHYNTVDTVYFSVPDRLFKEYGYLQKIRAEWWEYKTKMALILSDQSFVNFALQYVGKEVGSHNPDGDYLTRSHDKNIPFNAYSRFVMGGDSVSYYWTFNIDLLDWKAGGVGKAWEKSCEYVSNMLPFVFYSKAPDLDSFLDLFYTSPVAGDVSSSEVVKYMYDYKNDLGHGYIDCNGRQISKDLFETTVDSGRTMGHNDKTIDFADTFDLNSYDSNHSWWDKLLDFGFSWPSTNGDYENVAPIYEVKASDLTGSNADISNSLLVNEDDVSDLKTFYAKEVAQGNRVILFRFASTDYYSENAIMTRTDLDDNSLTEGYVAQQTVFLDFDIIELTFNKDGVYHVIPVVSSPMDIVNGFNPPPSGLEWWKIVLAVLLLIVFIVLLAPVLPYVFKVIVWIISLPFKAISRISKSFKNANKDTTNAVTAEDVSQQKQQAKKKRFTTKKNTKKHYGKKKE